MQVLPLYILRRYIDNLLLIHFNAGVDIVISLNIALSRNPYILESYYVKRALDYKYHYLMWGCHQFYSKASHLHNWSLHFHHGCRKPYDKNVLLIETNTFWNDSLEIQHIQSSKCLRYFIDINGHFKVSSRNESRKLSELEFHIEVEEMIANFNC